MIKAIENIDKDDFLEMCDECLSYISYKISDVKKSFSVYYIQCPVCGNMIEVIKEGR